MIVRKADLKWLPVWAFALAANGFFLFRLLSGDQFLWVRIINYFLPWAGVLAGACLAAAVVSKKAKLSAALGVPFLMVGVIYAPLFLNCKANAAGSGNILTVMSFNIWSNNQRMDACADVILKENPDILLLQEITPDQMSVLWTRLSQQEWVLSHDAATQQAIISRYPIGRSEFFFWKNRSQKAVIETPHGPVTVINVHAYKHGWQERHRLMQTILDEDVVAVDGPLILGGDFNTTDQSETFRMIRRHLTNAHDAAGCGFGFTFPTTSRFFSFRRLGPLPKFPVPPLIRIDHIFHNSHFTSLRARTLKDSGGSDHRPVVAVLGL
jgi:vancomycin resistance protein VanJ